FVVEVGDRRDLVLGLRNRTVRAVDFVDSLPARGHAPANLQRCRGAVLVAKQHERGIFDGVIAIVRLDACERAHDGGTDDAFGGINLVIPIVEQAAASADLRLAAPTRAKRLRAGPVTPAQTFGAMQERLANFSRTNRVDDRRYPRRAPVVVNDAEIRAMFA